MKPQFSKLIVFFAGLLLILALLHGIMLDSSSDNSMIDRTALATELTVTGSVFLTVCVWYYKKSATENTAKIRIDHAKEVAQIEYEFFEKRARLSKELGLTEADIEKINNDTVLDDMSRDAISEDTQYLNTQFDIQSADPEIERL